MYCTRNTSGVLESTRILNKTLLHRWYCYPGADGAMGLRVGKEPDRFLPSLSLASIGMMQ